MKNKTLLTSLAIVASLFIGCGSSSNTTTPTSEGDSSTPENGTSNNNETNLPDIVLKKGQYKICTKATSFSVEPTENPKVNFTKDIINGEINVSVNQDSTGFVTLKNCTVL